MNIFSAPDISKAFFYSRRINIFRGLSVGLVVLVHFGQQFSQFEVVMKLKPVLDLGKNGVSFFFCLSGFLLTMSLKRLPLTKMNVKKYFYRRFWRIYPAYFLCLIILSSLLDVTKKDFFYHLILLHSIKPETFGSISYSFWSLSVEMIFYLFLPIILWILNKISISRFFYYISFLGMSWQLVGGVFRNYGAFDTNYAWSSGLYILSALPAFTAGIFLYYNVDKKSLGIFHLLSLIAIIDIFISVTQVFVIELKPPIEYFKQATYGTFGFLIYGSLGLVTLKYLFEIKKIFSGYFGLFLSKLGVVSYSVYLWHLPILIYTKSLHLNLIMSISLSFILIFVTSSISYFLIEKPFMNWSKKEFN